MSAKPIASNSFTRPKAGANRVDLALSLFENGQKAYSMLKGVWRDKFAYSVVVSEKDPLYSEVYDWLVGALPEERHRSLSISSRKNRHEDYETSDSSAPALVSPKGKKKEIKPLTIRFNDSSTRVLTLNGHRVSVSVQQPEETAASAMSNKPMYAKIEFVTTSYSAQQAIVKKLEEINTNRGTERKPMLKMVGNWGSWTTRSDVPLRSLESVSLPGDQLERIMKDLGGFLEAENDYNRLAIPWHRGYMFHGPPGTGKTSLVKALANEFNLDLWYISLSDLKAEASLLGLLSEVGPRSILLLEDIDTIRITHDRDGSEQGTISMSSLLNTLDGVATPHGLITVMTTNRFDILDTALTRAGRMDMVEKLDYPSVDTLAKMFKHFYGTSPEWDIKHSSGPIQGLATAQISEIMKRNMKDPETASSLILEEVEKYERS